MYLIRDLINLCHLISFGKAHIASELFKELKGMRDVELIHIKSLISEAQEFKAVDILLELLLFCTGEDKLNLREDPGFLTVIRCTIRLLRAKMTSAHHWSRNEVSLICSIYEKALLNVTRLKSAKVKQSEEYAWLFTMSWNLAIEACQSQQFAFAVQFLSLADQLINQCHGESADNSKKRRSDILFLMTMDYIELARAETSQAVRNENWISANTALERWSQLQGVDKNNALIYQLEFEIAIELKQWHRAEVVLENLLQEKQKDSITLERMASICLRCMDCPAALVCTILQNTLDLLLAEWQSGSGKLAKTDEGCVSMDLDKFSVWFRSLVTVANRIPTKAFEYFCQFAEMVAGVKDAYPENELIWLINSCWNKGVDFFNSSNIPECQKWCSKSLEISSQINDQSINRHLTALFSNMMHESI